MSCLLRLRLALVLALLPLAGACEAGEAGEAVSPDRPALGLMGTIPVYWGESEALGDLVAGSGAEHWARERIETRFAIVPLDSLSEENLAGLARVILAQPRPLTPAENVALDGWVRDGGLLLLFADPMLTGRSRYAIGDRRRPQDVILLSPILDHWGLGLRFDADRPAGSALARADGAAIPVNRPGAFVAEAGSDCLVSAGGVLARCRIGKGEATVLADAAILDLYDPPAGAAEALDWLIDRAFAKNGEITGKRR